MGGSPVAGRRVLATVAGVLLAAGCASGVPSTTPSPTVPSPTSQARPIAPSADLPEGLREIHLAGGCFWGVEAYMERIDGVVDAVSGYANGTTENPSYEDLHRGSGHAETVRVWYDPGLVALDDLLLYFVRIIDPTSLNRQGPDSGEQYRTGVYWVVEADRPVIEERLAQVQEEYDEPVVVEVEPLRQFFPAEDHHQDHLAKNPGGYCHIDLSLAEEPLIRAADFPRPDEEGLRERLTDLQYRVTQEDRTERAFDNLYDGLFDPGIYVDVATGEPLFSSRDKFHSGTGWPSFTRPVVPYVVTHHPDGDPPPSGAEVRSRAGDSHLGHVFADGPEEDGGLRYCINSAALRFVPLANLEAEGYGDVVELARLAG
ncbi:MAG: peptide-methionine (S)-S-oxide reductase MsrA [Actinomycetota bacterium]